MAIDPRIPLMAVPPRRNLLADAGNLMQLKAAQTQMQQQSELRNALRGATAEQVPDIYLQQGYGAEGLAAGASLAQQRGAQLKELETKLNITARLLGSSTDQQSYDRALGLANQYGLPTQGAPKEFNKAWVDQKLLETMDAAQRFGLQIQMGQYDLAKQTAAREEKKTSPEYLRQQAQIKEQVETEAKREREKPEAQRSATDAISNLGRLAESARELKNHPGLPRITGMMGAFPNIPGQVAAEAEAKLEALRSQVAFSVLQAMREASKTGGALGNVSDAEGKRLENNLAALSTKQGTPAFEAELQKIIDYAEGAKGRISGAYERTYGETFLPAETTPVTETSGWGIRKLP